jgi:hypothetical protein
MVEGARPVSVIVVPNAVQVPIFVSTQELALKASTLELELVIDDGAVSFTRISTAVVAAGVVKLYQTSKALPQLPVGLLAVDKLRVPFTVLHDVLGISAVKPEQDQVSDACENAEIEQRVHKSAMVVVRIIDSMVNQGFEE